ncbi:hypothetical protein [Micromonospora sp. NPDC085948]|uniref:hypothetical protein n=1 Tax=Micromonospora sp. NPDC085948 TaxID=3155293 RepID=UPI0034124F6E
MEMELVEVDVDLVTDPVLGRAVEALDAWRIRWFLDETADDGYNHEDIVEACIRPAREGYLREVVEGRWRRQLQDHEVEHDLHGFARRPHPCGGPAAARLRENPGYRRAYAR